MTGRSSFGRNACNYTGSEGDRSFLYITGMPFDVTGPECGKRQDSLPHSCPECACPLEVGETECPECGCPVSGGTVACPDCGTLYDALLTECPVCACPKDALRGTSPKTRHPDYALSVLRTVWRVVTGYGDFSGRARRSEFWTFVVFNCMVGFVLYLTLFGCMGRDYVFVTEAATTGEYWHRLLYTCVVEHLPVTVVVAVYVLLALLPLLSVTVRRLHDTGRSGWWVLLLAVLPYLCGLLLGFSPYIGCTVLAVMLLLDSTPGTRWRPGAVVIF